MPTNWDAVLSDIEAETGELVLEKQKIEKKIKRLTKQYQNAWQQKKAQEKLNGPNHVG